MLRVNWLAHEADHALVYVCPDPVLSALSHCPAGLLAERVLLIAWDVPYLGQAVFYHGVRDDLDDEQEPPGRRAAEVSLTPDRASRLPAPYDTARARFGRSRVQA